MGTVAKHLPARLSALEEVDGVSIRNEAMLPQGSASIVATRGRFLSGDARTKGRAVV
jgi:hypothetical protein